MGVTPHRSNDAKSDQTLSLHADRSFAPTTRWSCMRISSGARLFDFTGQIEKAREGVGSLRGIKAQSKSSCNSQSRGLDP